VINDSNVIRNNILPLFATFPPLTTRMHLQLSFLIKALAGITMDEYFSLRDSKYSMRSSITPLFKSIPVYFDS